MRRGEVEKKEEEEEEKRQLFYSLPPSACFFLRAAYFSFFAFFLASFSCSFVDQEEDLETLLSYTLQFCFGVPSTSIIVIFSNCAVKWDSLFSINPFPFARPPWAMTWFICLPRRPPFLFWRRCWRNCDSSFAPKIYECIALVHRLCQSVPSNNQTPRPFMFLPSSPICRCTAVDISGGLDVIRFLLLCHQRRQRLLLSAAPFEPISQVDGLAIMIHRVATQQYGQSKIHTANWSRWHFRCNFKGLALVDCREDVTKD